MIKNIKNQFQKSCKKIQKSIFDNKKSKGFNITNVPLQFCFIEGELAEAFVAWHKKKDDLGEEIADVAIYLFGLASILKIDLGNEIVKKIEKNKKREYHRIKGVLLKKGKRWENGVNGKTVSMGKRCRKTVSSLFL